MKSFIIEFKFKAVKTAISKEIQIIGSTADKAMQLIEKDESITIAALANKMGVSEITIRRILDDLQKSKK